MKKVIALAAIGAYTLATIGCFGVCLYYHYPQFAVPSVVNSALAFPTLRKLVKDAKFFPKPKQ